MEKLTIAELRAMYPYVDDFFDVNGLIVENDSQTVVEYFYDLPYLFLEDMGLEHEGLIKHFRAFMSGMQGLDKTPGLVVDSLTIIGGTDKSGQREQSEVTIERGEIICIVGPTGSGKSRLLADIEWMAQGDTPTGRKILINDAVPQESWRFSIDHKLVAQLSQNMNFVMDVSVEDFVRLHAYSRMIREPEKKIDDVISCANELAGEIFDPRTPLTSLSGGQSRALMVADTALLSASPIVLIDEIENAGINRIKAMKLLVDQNKIVLIATHDPLLALVGNKRIVVKNGGISQIIETSEIEKRHLERIIKLDEILIGYRERIRNGEVLHDLP